MPNVHAFLSASSAARWTNCPPSAKLCATMPDSQSPYAQQGTDAHSLCEHLLLKALHRPTKDPTEDLQFYDDEMQSAAEGYRDFCLEQIEDAKDGDEAPFVSVEQRLNFSRWVPEGFGTGDCVIVGSCLHIVDFKYGVGVLVSAEKNPQLMCYALGAYDAFGALYPIERVKLSIYQPRREHVDTYEMPISELLDWAENILAPAAVLAKEGRGEFKAGSHCQFCKVKANCRERARYNMELAKYDFMNPDLLSTEDIAEILPQIDSLVSWASDVKDFALEHALSGTHYAGFKLVEGRSTRKYTDDQSVIEAVEKAGFDPYEKKLRGVTAMTSELGKKKFNELLGGLICKPPGKPVLVPESDKRKELATNDFMTADEG